MHTVVEVWQRCLICDPQRSQCLSCSTEGSENSQRLFAENVNEFKEVDLNVHKIACYPRVVHPD